MKHLKRFNERLGILSGLEEQEIEKKPISRAFKFVYRCDLGNYNFKLYIDPKLDCRGYFQNSLSDNLEIYIKDRTDGVTLLHELKQI